MKSCNNIDEVNEVINSTYTSISIPSEPKIVNNTMTQTVLIAHLIPLQTWNDYHGRQNY